LISDSIKVFEQKRKVSYENNDFLIRFYNYKSKKKNEVNVLSSSDKVCATCVCWLWNTHKGKLFEIISIKALREW